MTKPLLIEIGVEELPAIPLLKILKNIENSWASILKNNQLETPFEFHYTPRRLVLIHEAMPLAQADSTTEHFGPPVQAAFKDGEPTGAAQGFARKCGVSIDELGRGEKGGREVLYFKEERKGEATETLLADMVKTWVGSMEFGKMMRWGSRSEEFIRPIRWLQVRLGDSIVPATLFGVKSSDKTFVHRMVEFDAVEVPSIAEYETILEKGSVVLRADKRREMITAQFDAIEADGTLSIERDAELLEEVVAITENPKALVGSFDEDFLTLPPEVIITSMKEHQRYFAVFAKGTLANKFVVVSNAVTDDYAKVIAGNERVLRPRLTDALFFYHNDMKRGLVSTGLEKIQFMDGLGSLLDKSHREANIAIRLLARYMERAEEESGKSAAELEMLMDKAVKLAKCDLTSEMVYEFTELQGLMGYYYAKSLGEDALVYNAIKEQYMPVGEGADLPASLFSAIVAMSIKLDTLMGLFSIGKIPSGSKDPFALRRAVNGITRIAVAYDLSFDIDEIVELIKDAYAPFDYGVLGEFIMERVSKSLGANPSLIAAVLASGEKDVNEITKKVNALESIVSEASFKEQFSTFKRVANISKELDLASELPVDTALFEIDAEKSLYGKYMDVISVEYQDYRSHLGALFSLKNELDSYFDGVMVNTEDEKLRTNRQNTIGRIYRSFKEIADIKEVTL